MAILYASIGCAAVAGGILDRVQQVNRRRQVALAGIPAGETEALTAQAMETAEAPESAGGRLRSRRLGHPSRPATGRAKPDPG